MCGICGFLEKKRGDSEEMIRKMSLAIHHRGPDAVGGFCIDGLAVGHRRLSIIDLSDSANQPMKSLDGRYCLVFNGEVYNFRELVAEYGLVTRTASDTEVVLQLLIRFGVDALEMFNGMFALAFLDTEKEELLIARDRLGIKPLYYLVNGNKLLFASELKAIQALYPNGSTLRLNLEAVQQYLHLGYIPTPNSIYKEVSKLGPGTWLKWRSGAFELGTWWKPSLYHEDRVIKSEQIALDLLQNELHQAVSKRLLSDVKLGCFLSGGTDSSLIASIAQDLLPGKLSTFSLAFAEATFDESKYARAVAQQIGSDHHEFRVSLEEAEALLNSIDEVYDEPYADSSAIPTQILSRKTSLDVKVVLSGDGGDETHLGYGSYVWASRFNNQFLRNLRWPIAKVLSLGPSRFKRAAWMFKWNCKENLPSHIFSQEQYAFSESEISNLLLRKEGKLFFDEPFQTSRVLDSVEKQALFDLSYYLPEDLLTKVDRASMKHGLEVRVPLLDHNLVQLAINIDAKLRFRDRESKYLLKKILTNYISPELVYRKKWGFAIPLSKWMKSLLRSQIEADFSPENIAKTNLFNAIEVQTLLDRYFSGLDYLYNRVWILWNLQKWLLKYTGSAE